MRLLLIVTGILMGEREEEAERHQIEKSDLCEILLRQTLQWWNPRKRVDTIFCGQAPWMVQIWIHTADGSGKGTSKEGETLGHDWPR